MLKEFRAFIARGNVLDLAVAVVIGAAFGTIVTAFTEDLIMPVIGLITGGVDFSQYFIKLGSVPASYAGAPDDYAALKKAGVPMIGFGKPADRRHQLPHHRLCHLPAGQGGQQGGAQEGRPCHRRRRRPTEALLAEIRDELRARKL